MPIIELTLSDGTTRRVEIDGEPTEELIQNEIIPAIESGQFSSEEVEQSTEQPQPKEPITEKGIDITPSGLLQKGAAATTTLAKMLYDTGFGRNNPDKIESPEEAIKYYNDLLEGSKQIESEHPIATGVANLGTDLAGYSLLPFYKGNGAFIKNALMQGGVTGGLEGLKRDDLTGGATTGTAIAAAMQGIVPPAIKGAGNLAGKIANSKFAKETLPKMLEFLTSVPEKYTQRAIEKELAGNSLFADEFNPQIMNEKYRDIGKRAIEGYQDAKLAANKELNEATRNLNNLPDVDKNNLLNQISKDVDVYAYGGDTNAALDQKGADILKYIDDIANSGQNTGLHVIKENIQNAISGKYGKESGAGINALKDVARNINEELYGISPAYKDANVAEKNLHEIKDYLAGMNPKTMGSRIRNVEGDAAVRSGYEAAANKLDELVNPQYKFMDDVRDLRAREALEQAFSGQGGGFGSEQGAGNAFRTKVLPPVLAGIGGLSGFLGGGVKGAITGGTLSPLAQILLTSPKVMAKGAVKNVGKLSNFSKKALKGAYDKAIAKLTPAAVKAVQPLLYGGVSNTTDNYTDYDTTQY